MSRLSIKDYLGKKYGRSQASTLLKAEAKIFGIKFPLQSGWLATHGARLISDEQAARLTESMKARIAGKLEIKALREGNGSFDYQPVLDLEWRALEALEEMKATTDPAPAKWFAPQNGVVWERVQGVTGSISFDILVQKRGAPTPPAVATDDFLRSYAWRQLRMQALVKYGARCQCCGATPAHGARMNVDHIKPRKFYPALALDINNLQVLCGECNHGKGNWDATDWRGNGAA